VDPCSSQSFVRAAIIQQLQAAAEAEVIKARSDNLVSLSDILRDAEEAVEALSALLGDDSWFFRSDMPGMFDASVFAYTHLILDESLGWQHNPLGDMVNRYENLVLHRNRILDRYFG
jgi:metaxin